MSYNRRFNLTSDLGFTSSYFSQRKKCLFMSTSNNVLWRCTRFHRNFLRASRLTIALSIRNGTILSGYWEFQTKVKALFSIRFSDKPLSPLLKNKATVSLVHYFQLIFIKLYLCQVGKPLDLIEKVFKRRSSISDYIIMWKRKVQNKPELHAYNIQLVAGFQNFMKISSH